MLEQVISQLERPQEVISVDYFRNWRRDPVTQSLFHDLMVAFLETLGDDLPESLEGAAARALKREGALAMIEQLWNWMPDSVRKDLEKREAAGEVENG